MKEEDDEKKHQFIMKSSMTPLFQDRRVKVSPEHLVTALRDWAERDTEPPVIDCLIPFFVGKAIRAKDAAGSRVMTAARRTQDAIEAGQAERAAAYSALMICEALMAAYVPDNERTEMELMDAKWKLKKAHDNGIGAINSDLKTLENMAINLAAEIWRNNPNVRIGIVADMIAAKMQVCKNEDKNWPANIERVPIDNTIKGWFKRAAQDGRLTIPEAARRPGAPKKK